MVRDHRLPAGNLLRLAALPLVLLALSLALVACSSGSNKHTGAQNAVTTPAASGVATQNSSTTAVAASASAAATSTTPPDTSPLAEFMLPKFNVDAKVVVKGVDPATNTMESPDNKDDVAYYNFTSQPGYGCQGTDKCANTVLAGHVDWYTGETGVFWHLKDLKTGDQVQLKLQDGTVYKYKVVSNDVYSDADAPVAQIIGQTPQESVTLITCDGVFNKSLREYNSRRVVRAVRES
jgi:LPXTG-site transpeptidase (sortase) family protein